MKISIERLKEIIMEEVARTDEVLGGALASGAAEKLGFDQNRWIPDPDAIAQLKQSKNIGHDMTSLLMKFLAHHKLPGATMKARVHADWKYFFSGTPPEQALKIIKGLSGMRGKQF